MAVPKASHTQKEIRRGLPDGPVVKNSVLQMLGVWVPSLVKESRFHMPLLKILSFNTELTKYICWLNDWINNFVFKACASPYLNISPYSGSSLSSVTRTPWWLPVWHLGAEAVIHHQQGAKLTHIQSLIFLRMSSSHYWFLLTDLECTEQNAQASCPST